MASQPPYNSRDVHAQRRASIPVFDSNTNLHSNYECGKGEYKLIIKEKHKDHAQSSEAITFELMDNLHTQLTRSQTWIFRWNDRPEGLGDVLPTRPLPLGIRSIELQERSMISRENTWHTDFGIERKPNLLPILENTVQSQ